MTLERVIGQLLAREQRELVAAITRNIGADAGVVARHSNPLVSPPPAGLAAAESWGGETVRDVPQAGAFEPGGRYSPPTTETVSRTLLGLRPPRTDVAGGAAGSRPAAATLPSAKPDGATGGTIGQAPPADAGGVRSAPQAQPVAAPGAASGDAAPATANPPERVSASPDAQAPTDALPPAPGTPADGDTRPLAATPAWAGATGATEAESHLAFGRDANGPGAGVDPAAGAVPEGAAGTPETTDPRAAAGSSGMARPSESLSAAERSRMAAGPGTHLDERPPESRATGARPTVADAPAGASAGERPAGSAFAQGTAAGLALPERAGIIASFVLNAAMIPGWPPPRPIEGVRTEAAAALRQLRQAANETEAVEALARMGLARDYLSRIAARLAAWRRRVRVLFGLVVLLNATRGALAALVEDDPPEMDEQIGGFSRRFQW